ncbi:His-Xaa-Ser system protein HxsD [Clostridiaceae bacterium UIB06]|nr:His-Xaa-Ser system protein HxsD [Clostridiaceae bacterium UIB06]
MSNITHVLDEDKIIFLVNEEIYSLTAVMKTAYMFIEKVYIYFDYEKEKVIRVEFTTKETYDRDHMEKMVKEFYNELLNQALRLKVFKDTKNIRELILGRALYDTCIETEGNNSLSEDFSFYEINEEDEKQQFNDEDTLNIAKAFGEK